MFLFELVITTYTFSSLLSTCKTVLVFPMNYTMQTVEKSQAVPYNKINRERDSYSIQYEMCVYVCLCV